MDIKTKVVTGKVRFSYANVWKPKSTNGGDERYGASLIIPKSDTKTIADIRAAAQAAIETGRVRFEDAELKELKLPLRDGDAERPLDEAYRNSFYINASSKDKPHIVDKDIKPITNESEFYSGCYGRASINFFTFNISGNRGVGCGLLNLQKLSDGERLTYRSSAEEDFKISGDENFLD